MAQTPTSAFTPTSDMLYFARMLDKIRKHERGELREDFHAHLGKGLDGRCCNFLRVEYSDLIKETLKGGSDISVLDWCFTNGRALDENDILIWNHFLSKLGWRDMVTEMLDERKAQSGLSDRDEIVTMAEYFEYDEGRK
ncbi:MAG: DUF5069 domain-containing protein [Opitutaceae bacterium]